MKRIPFLASSQNFWLVFMIALGISQFDAALAQTQESRLIRQTQTEADQKSRGCLFCHGKIENKNMHKNTAIKLGCADCHGGDAAATTVKGGHVKPREADKWKPSANPVNSFTLLNKESPEFIKFVNPGDLRVADETCGPCHGEQVLRVKKSMMTTSSLLLGGAAYNNGILSTKNYILGESYSRDGFPQPQFGQL